MADPRVGVEPPAGGADRGTTSYVVNAAKLYDQEQLSEQLKTALQSRVVIEQAKGIIARRRSVTLDRAFELIGGRARTNHASLRVVAEAIVGVGRAL